MSVELLRWLNQEVGISSTDESDFSNGYRLGETLFRLSMLDETTWNKFSDSNSPKALLNNFQHLSTALRRHRIPFSSQLARGIMSQENGSAMQLLHQIRLLHNTLKVQSVRSSQTTTLPSISPSKTSTQALSSTLGADFRSLTSKDITDERRMQQLLTTAVNQGHKQRILDAATVKFRECRFAWL